MSLALAAGCDAERGRTSAPPTYREVATILVDRCGACHSGEAPAAGWRATDYGAVIACTSDGRPVTIGGASAPLLGVLDRADHAGRLAPDERRRIAAWLEAGAPSTTGGVHPPTFADPRTADGHARFLRARRYRPMVDVDDPDRCGHCHAGASTTPPVLAAPGATPCTSCHTEPEGVRACSTCHGAPGRSYPPHDPCFFPEAASSAGAHAVHAGPAATHAEGMPCATCHPTPDLANVLDLGTHMNTHVEVRFDAARAGSGATWDCATGQCAGTCHAHGGTKPVVAWADKARATCTDCHGVPPPNHLAGPCSSCHREATADGRALVSPKLHVNGKADLGDGTRQCGACHGRGDDAWPSTGSHAAHASPSSAAPVPCFTCHAVPTAVGPQHPHGGPAIVTLRGLAVAGGSPASYDPATKTCAATYCHAGRGATVPSPAWGAGPSAVACGACHAAPPPPPHAASTDCSAQASCHQGSLAAPTVFTPLGKAAHVDGLVTRGPQGP